MTENTTLRNNIIMRDQFAVLLTQMKEMKSTVFKAQDVAASIEPPRCPAVDQDPRFNKGIYGNITQIRSLLENTITQIYEYLSVLNEQIKKGI